MYVEMPPPIVYFKTEWMDFYDGRKGDKPPGNFLFVAERGEAHEDHNFRVLKGRTYAYAPIAGGGGGVGIGNLGAQPSAKYVDGVDLVFIAKGRDKRGVVVVGWYRNARIYRTLQARGRRFYLAECDASTAVRIPSDERWLRIVDPPRRSNVWYGRPDMNAAVRQLMNGARTRSKVPKRSVTHDAERCLQVELAAYDAVMTYFRTRGYVVTNVSRDNVGWDLEARRGDSTLLLEVKGTEQSELRAELTPNEFTQSALQPGYRICIVTDALVQVPNVYVFKGNHKARWYDEFGTIELLFTKRTAARLTTRLRS